MCCVFYTLQHRNCMAALESWLTEKKRISKISQKLTELFKKDYGCFKRV